MSLRSILLYFNGFRNKSKSHSCLKNSPYKTLPFNPFYFNLIMTSKSMESSSKKSMRMRNDARDRLSELPDEILVHILSFLPILDAVKTVLIRRFGNLWTLVSSIDIEETEIIKSKNWPPGEIDFDDEIHSDKQIHLFARFVRNVLLLHKGFPVNKFRLHFDDLGNHERTIDADVWIRFAIDRQVKELEVQYNGEDYCYILPRFVFTSQFLVKLELDRCKIDGLSRVQMGSLRKLSLLGGKVSNEMFKKIVFGCPSLQELVLMYVRELDELQFTSPNIEKLEFDSDDISKLDCPNLKILIINGESSLQVVNIPSIREVHIKSIEHLDTIVNSKAEVVKLLNGAIQQSYFKEINIPETKWKSLHIQSQLKEDELIGICRVLRSSPHLEELIVFSSSWHKISQKSSKTHNHHMFSEEFSAPWVFPQLKTVIIRGHKLPCQGLLQLAEFLLKSCVNLEKMVILPRMFYLIKENKFLKQLCNFSRASANARVICDSK